MIVTLNKPNKTISMHRKECFIVKNKLGKELGKIDKLSEYKDGYKTESESGQVHQIWFTEENFSLEKVKKFFGNIDYCKIFCQRCFR